MGHLAVMGFADGLGVCPLRARLVLGLAWLPLLLARRHLPGRNIDAENALDRINGDDVAILDQTDRAADRRFRADMADAEAARGAGDAAVSDQCHFLTHALAVDRRGDRKSVV